MTGNTATWHKVFDFLSISSGVTWKHKRNQHKFITGTNGNTLKITSFWFHWRRRSFYWRMTKKQEEPTNNNKNNGMRNREKMEETLGTKKAKATRAHRTSPNQVAVSPIQTKHHSIMQPMSKKNRKNWNWDHFFWDWKMTKKKRSNYLTNEFD